MPWIVLPLLSNMESHTVGRCVIGIMLCQMLFHCLAAVCCNCHASPLVVKLSKAPSQIVMLTPPHKETGWSHPWVLHGPEDCAVVFLNRLSRRGGDLVGRGAAWGATWLETHVQVCRSCQVWQLTADRYVGLRLPTRAGLPAFLFTWWRCCMRQRNGEAAQCEQYCVGTQCGIVGRVPWYRRFCMDPLP